MKRTYFSGVTVAMALVAGPYALAEGPETQKMLAMIGYIDFITQISSLEYAGQDLPDVTVLSENELQLLVRSSEAEVSANEDDRSFALVSAFYDRSANKIFLADANSIAGPGLFHELVHFLQAINDKDDMFISHRACLEAEAYELQAIWQTEQGIDLASKPEYGFIMTLYGACNDADFSWIDSAYTNAHNWAGSDPNPGQISD
jgi:hypothetical protein